MLPPLLLPLPIAAVCDCEPCPSLSGAARMLPAVYADPNDRRLLGLASEQLDREPLLYILTLGVAEVSVGHTLATLFAEGIVQWFLWGWGWPDGQAGEALHRLIADHASLYLPCSPTSGTASRAGCWILRCAMLRGLAAEPSTCTWPPSTRRRCGCTAPPALLSWRCCRASIPSSELAGRAGNDECALHGCCAGAMGALRCASCGQAALAWPPSAAPQAATHVPPLFPGPGASRCQGRPAMLPPCLAA